MLCSTLNVVGVAASHVPLHPASPYSPTLSYPEHLLDQDPFNARPGDFPYSPSFRSIQGPLNTWLMNTPNVEGPEPVSRSYQEVIIKAPDYFISSPCSKQTQCLDSHPQPSKHSTAGIPDTDPLIGMPQFWSFATHEARAFSPMHAGDCTFILNSNIKRSPNSADEYVPQTFGAGDRTLLDEDCDVNIDMSSPEFATEKEASSCSRIGCARSSEGSEAGPSHVHSDHSHLDTRVTRLWMRKHLCTIQSCGSTFVRPEHLRRHVSTKHAPDKEHCCKVPGCKIRFSRSDNLRYHYWTHLQREGRAGKNKKFTLAKLESILGPKQEKLVQHLGEQLKRHKAKAKTKKARTTRPTTRR